MGSIFCPSGVIYGLINSDTFELRYVGQTVGTPGARLQRHRQSHYNPHLRRWLDKYPVSAIVLERDPADLNEAERRWIADARAGGARLLNLTDGGEGMNGHRPSAESRAKMSVAHIGMRPSEETRTKISAATRASWQRPEIHSKISAAVRAAWCRPEVRAKWSGVNSSSKRPEVRAKNAAAHIGIRPSEETRVKMCLAQRNRRRKEYINRQSIFLIC